MSLDQPRRAQPPPLRIANGAVWMLVSALLFTAMLAVFKLIGSDIPIVQVLFLRQMMVLAVVVPSLAESLAPLRSGAPTLQIVRVLLSGVAMLAGFTAVVHLPLAESTTLAFTRVVFVVMLGAALLGEHVGRQRWTAVGIGFLGVLIVAAPSPTTSWNPYALLSIAAALCTAGVTVTLRRLTAVDGPRTIMLWHSAGLLVLLAPPSWFAWQWPTLEQWALIVVLGGLMAGAQWTTIRALQLSEASAMAPFEYTRLIWAALFGFLVFGDVPDVALAVGAAFVLSAAILASRSQGR